MSLQRHYVSGDVNNNSINSAHGHQPKGTTVLWRRYSLGRTRRSRAVLRVLWVHLRTWMHAGELKQPQSALFEGSRLSQRGRASVSIHVCTCTSQQELDQCVPHDVASGCFIALAHVPCDVTNDIRT